MFDIKKTIIIFLGAIYFYVHLPIIRMFDASISYHLPLRPLFCLFLNGRLREV